jgi:hypothetical protein
MDEKLAQQILDELLEPIQDIETQSAAILALLKAKGLATDEDFAPHLQQASKGSSVRGVATRARVSRLLSAALMPVEKPAEEPADQETKQSDERQSAPAEEKSKDSIDSADTKSTPENAKQSPPGENEKDAKRKAANEVAQAGQEAPKKDSAASTEANSQTAEENNHPTKETKPQPEAA